jgi:hypothetical protein
MVAISPPIDERSVSSAPARVAQLTRLLTTLTRSPADIRFVVRYVDSRGHNPVQLGLPWLPYSVIDALAERAKAATVFEYGGGGSTLWFARRAARVVTVEHDEQWHAALVKATSHLDSVDVLLKPLASEDGASYVTAIDRYKEECFDIVAVDGRHRVECVRRAMTKVRPGGLLLLDDSDRPKYGSAREILSNWTARDFFGLVPCKDRPGTTTLFTKPIASDSD